MSKNASGNNRIVVDWDGTCVTIAYPKMGKWLKGAPDALRRMVAAGYEVVIFSTRLAPCEIDEVTPRDMTRDLQLMRTMLDIEELEDVQIWTLPWKPGAIAYIDDKGIEYKRDWQAIVDRLKV